MNKTTSILSFFFLIVFFAFSNFYCGNDAEKQEKFQNPPSNKQIAPEKQGGEPTGTTAGENSTDEEIFYSDLAPQSGVYPNGDNGYNLVVLKGDVTPAIDAKKVFGVCADGLYYIQSELADKYNPNQKNQVPFRMGGIMTAKENKGKMQWTFQKTGKLTVAGVDFYVFRSPTGKPEANKNGCIVFCGWYEGTHFFLPHEAVKDKAKGKVRETAMEPVNKNVI